MRTIAVFGATGYAGRCLTRLLLDDRETEVVACARDEGKLADLSSSLAGAQGTLRTRTADVGSDRDIESIVSRADLVIGATSRSTEGYRLATAALARSTSYFGIYLSSAEKWRRLRRLHDECVERGVMLIEDGGVHPGMPAALIRWAAEDAELKSAWVGAKFGLKWDELDLAPETVDDFVAEMKSMDPSVLLEGQWVRGYRHSRAFDFGDDGDGRETCAPMCLEEIRELGRLGTSDSLGFFIAGFGPLVDYAAFPLSVGLAKVNRRLASTLIKSTLGWFASTSGHAIVLLEAERADGGSTRVRVSHADPYFLTAAAAVLAVRQMVEEPRPGVWTQGGFVRPGPLFRGLKDMGVQVERSSEAR